MLRSLYSGVSGMKSQQTRLDVISNNIANANTIGFKSSRANFSDILSQTTANASGPRATVGGIDGKQVGLGVQVGAIDTDMGQGIQNTTGRALDLYINGSGFLVFERDGNNGQVYSRNGALKIDANGNLTNADGLRVMGYAPGKEGGALTPITVPAQNAAGEKLVEGHVSIGPDGKVTARYGAEDEVIGTVSIATFSNPAGLSKIGNSTYEISQDSGNANNLVPGTDGTNTLLAGTLEDSNVDLAQEFSDMIVTSRAYQANARSITTSDEMLQELINLKR
ncbi:flagellar hook-basal body complex protein [Latilactobacillus curvatus]|uniref:flagellar hook-basal body complex protein n=1 Tax=Latilactobacillus curvatus TaxID=28038 RepID=UPI00217DA5C7|nr:flagellar hook-basal body complex protein [Latilactobacillus curvatus]MCS6142184.1 flagellar hook-basal body complex protein [Latilactobacillus curvatus]